MGAVPPAVLAFLGLLALLPFHRPPLFEALGPAAGAPELVAPLAFALLAAAWGRRLPPGRALAIPVALAAGLAPSVLAAPEPGRAAVQLGVVLYVSALHAGAVLLVELGQRLPALRALLAGAAVAAALGLAGLALEWAGLPSFGLAFRYPWMETTPRPVGPAESPSMLALVALGGLVAALALRRAGALGRRGLAAAAVLFGATLLLAQSRVLLAALAGAGVLLGLQWRHRAAARAAGVALASLGLALTLASITWRIVPVRASWPFADLHPSPYRVCHEIAARAFADHPLAGVGLEGFHAAWPRYYEPARHDPAYEGGGESLRALPRDPHGTLQGYLAEAGLAGAAALALVAWLLWRGRGGPESVALLAALAVASLSGDLLTERSTWALLGLLAATSRTSAAAAGPIGASRPDARRSASPSGPSSGTVTPSRSTAASTPTTRLAGTVCGRRWASPRSTAVPAAPSSATSR